MYAAPKFYSNILGYKTSINVGRNYALDISAPGIFNYSHIQTGFNIPYFMVYFKLATASGGPLAKSVYNNKWQTVDFSFMAGKSTTTEEIVDYLNSKLNFISAEFDDEKRITLTPQRCTDNPEEEVLVDFLITGAAPVNFNSQRADLQTNALLSASIFPYRTATTSQNQGSPNIFNTGFCFAPDKLGLIKTPSILPASSNVIDGTIGYITCCDGYTPTVRHQSGIWDLISLYQPLLIIRMFNKDTIIAVDADGLNVIPKMVGILTIRLNNMVYTSSQLADTINLSLAEISPCGQYANTGQNCSETDGTLPFVASASPDGRITICQSFYELSINGSCPYIDHIFSFDRISNDSTCSMKSGFLLNNIPSGCANDGFKTGKTRSAIVDDLDSITQIKRNFEYKTFEYTPLPVIENVMEYINQGRYYVYASTMTGPISDSPFAQFNAFTSIPSTYWVKNQYVPDSPYSEFWATFNLNEDDILKAIGKKVRILNIQEISAQVRASWNYFEYFSGAYITYPFYNWGLVLNTSSHCTLRPSKSADTITFSNSGISCLQAGNDFTSPIKPAWDSNTESLHYIRARNKSCNSDMTQIKDVEIPRIYGDYRMGVVFDWKRWSRFNPNGVDSLNFNGAFAIPSITFKIVYVN
jgi:hypothetical protein